MKKILKLSSIVCVLMLCFCVNVFAVWSIKLTGGQINVQHEINLAHQRRLMHPGVYDGRFNSGSPLCFMWARGKNALQVVVNMIKFAHDLNKTLLIRESNGTFYYNIN